MASDNIGRALKYHIFSHREKTFAFDPSTVRLVPLDEAEAAFLREVQASGGYSQIHGLPNAQETIGRLGEKGLFADGTARVLDPGKSVEVLVNATQECNLACAYCFVDRGQFSYGGDRVLRLSPETARRLVEALPAAFPEAPAFAIHFYGGEPLLNLPAIRAAVDAAKASPRRFEFSVTTNGTVWDEETLGVLREGRFGVVLSIDGPAPVHDAVRRTSGGDTTHARVREFLDRLKAAGLFVRGSSVVRSGWSLREASAYLGSLPVDAIKAQAVRLPPGKPLALDARGREEYCGHLAGIADDVIDCIRSERVPRDDRYSHRVLQVLCGARRTAFCGAGRWIFGMACDGTMLPCVLLAGMEGMSLGRIDAPGWAENGEAWAKARPLRDECGRCWALPLCGGGCPAMVSVCGEDECEIVRANCEMALAIYGSVEDKASLLVLAGMALEGT